ncbi:hypothetical protein CKF54_05465 [Psittacicella hinzii]|uniref:Outer membrane protein beta-barrel domain-containing protein n=1 Tax=Psittacicella hinzii TaxID=2028575 RepID=A0A3A1Y7C8_9GAMM|nr:outer membrane beta-barrel protein [Psittacicella hinzii]RIY32037.1 hypothetical protein CKF54_05465 [Psittacicella hinzii]
MKLVKSLAALTLVAGVFAQTANATTFADEKFRFDANLGFKVSHFSVKDSSTNYNPGSFQLNLSGHYFFFNNDKVAVGGGLEVGGSVGTYTVGSTNNHYYSSTYESTDERTGSRRFTDYNAGLSLLTQFRIENSGFVPYAQFSVGYQVADLRNTRSSADRSFKYKGVYVKLGGGVSWSNGFTAGVYVSYAPNMKSDEVVETKASNKVVGAQFGWKF